MEAAEREKVGAGSLCPFSGGSQASGGKANAVRQDPDAGRSVRTPATCTCFAQSPPAKRAPRGAAALPRFKRASLQLQKLLDTEAALCLEAKAALEEALTASARVTRDAAAEASRLRRDLDARDERVRRLELQLAAAGFGLGKGGAGNNSQLRASRASSLRGAGAGGGLRASVVAGSLEELGGVGEGESVIEFHVSEAVMEVGWAVGWRAPRGAAARRPQLAPPHLGVCLSSSFARSCWDRPHAAPAQEGAPGAPPADAPLFAAWDFYLHDSQATAVAPAPRPEWGLTVQYVVAADGVLGEYLATRTMQVRRCAGGRRLMKGIRGQHVRIVIGCCSAT